MAHVLLGEIAQAGKILDAPVRVFQSEAHPFERPLVEVTEGGKPLSGLNELEVIDGFLFANVYPSTRLVKIDPRSGQVVAWFDLGDLYADQPPDAAVPNGIAHDHVTGSVYLTGKYWARVYRVEL